MFLRVITLASWSMLFVMAVCFAMPFLEALLANSISQETQFNHMINRVILFFNNDCHRVSFKRIATEGRLLRSSAVASLTTPSISLKLLLSRISAGVQRVAGSKKLQAPNSNDCIPPTSPPTYIPSTMLQYPPVRAAAIHQSDC